MLEAANPNQPKEILDEIYLGNQDQTNQEVELKAQGITDIFRFLDREVVDKVTGAVKTLDVLKIADTANLLLNLIEVEDDGDVYLNLRIKIRDGKKVAK